MNDIEQQSDNTRVAMPLQRMPVIPYDYMAEALRIRQSTPEFKQDNRTESQKKHDNMVSDYLIYEDQKQKNLQEAGKAVDAMFTMISPSTYVGAATRNNGKSYWENVASGEGFGNFWGNFLFDGAVAGITGLAVKGLPTIAGKIPYKLNIPVDTNKYYRVVGIDAIDDANKSGLIRWKSTASNTLQDNNLGSKSLFDRLNIGSRSGGVPYFTRGKLYMPPQQGQAVIVGNNSIPWRRIGPKGRVNKYSPEDEISIGNSATPYVNDQFNNASTGAFEYWTRGNNFITKHLYKRHSFDAGADYTNRLMQLLGPSKSNSNLGYFNFITQKHADYLTSKGVDMSKFSSNDLLKLQSMRDKSIRKSSPTQEYIAVQQGGTTTPKTSYTLRTKNHENLADMEMSGNIVGNIEAIRPGHHSSEKLYNAGIKLNPNGIVSGSVLLSPEITYKVWSKYPNKRIIGRQGIHNFNRGRDIIKNGEPYTIDNGIQVLLKTPTNLILPIKSESIFDPSIIDVFNYKLKLPNWYDPNIYK